MAAPSWILAGRISCGGGRRRARTTARRRSAVWTRPCPAGTKILPITGAGGGGLIDDKAGTGDTEWRAARDEARAALSDALMWNLTAARWEQVQDAIADMAAAVTSARLDDLWQTTGRLELCSPLRVVTRLGETPQLPAPETIREQIVALISALAGDGNPSGGGKPGPVSDGTDRTATSRP